MDLTAHLQLLAALGGATLLTAWLPSLSERLRVSGTVILLGVGVAMYYLGAPLPWPAPFWPDAWAMAFTEAVVIISLMSAGLKVGRVYKRHQWRVPLRLLAVTMPLCIGAGVLLGYYFLGLPLETAMLLGAVLAPTDPVMAAEVQIDPTNKLSPFDDIRFGVTGEASLNDGLAYPFTWLAVLLAQAGGVLTEVDWTKWVFDLLLLKVGLGLLFGYIGGRAIGWLLQRLPETLGLKTRDGFVAFSATFLIYAAAELLHGYGFLAVFVAGLVIRRVEESYAGDRMKFRLHDFVSEIERLLLALFMLLFGGSIASGLISDIDWRGWAFGFAFIFLIRPLAGMLGLVGAAMGRRERWATSFLGIRGIGSIFYLTWAFLQTDFPARDEVYSTLGAVILLSILAHGLSARTLLLWATPEAEADEGEGSYEVAGEI